MNLRLFVFIACLLSFREGICQDTLIVINSKFESVYYKLIKSMVMKNDTIFLNRGSISERDLVASTLLTKPYHYCRFYDTKKRIIEEGRWYLEYFDGYYWSYFKNGKIKSNGEYSDNIKVGEWILNNKKGIIIHEDSYRTNGERYEWSNYRYYNNGKLKSKKSYNPGGFYHFDFYDRNGNLKLRRSRVS